MKKILLLLSGSLAFIFTQAQDCPHNTTVIIGRNCQTLNPITTAVPFLLIGPDSRSGAMGDAGVAISPDANAQHWNAAKLAFATKEAEISLSYSPWLRQLVSDMNLAYLAGYTKLNSTSTLGASLRYFTLGDITFTDNNGTTIRDFRPAEFAIDVSYSLQLSEYFSGGITGRYLNSNLTGGTSVGGADSKAANAFAVDISGFFRNDDLNLGDKDATLAFGMVISNIGNKVSYTNNVDQDFLPMNMRLGTALTVELDDYNKLTFAYDANKLLVPTPPIYDPDSIGFIIAGQNPEVGVAQGLFQSFGDAPGKVVMDANGVIQRNADNTAQIEKGSVFAEEISEITHSFGMEYIYADQFAVRGGYFNEAAAKGNRKYFTVGLGVNYRVLGVDISYLIPTAQRNPLANTIRFSLSLRFEDQATRRRNEG